MSAGLTHLFSLALSVFCLPCSSLKYKEAPLISVGMRVIVGAGTQRWFPSIRPTRAGLLSWLAGTTGSDLGEGHGCRRRPQ